ncbi:hypothetical protein MPSEU_000650600 [Mayamaea pseudoterrestris]|nr:hypothetical protein MPSEU_000650600 [Mayamaea pseudoterrestris]
MKGTEHESARFPQYVLFCFVSFNLIQASHSLQTSFNVDSVAAANRHGRIRRRPQPSFTAPTSTARPLYSQARNNNEVLTDGQLVDETFQELYAHQLPPWLLKRSFECGWIRPSRIQKYALDTILIDKHDAIIQAETGSGKTLSYLLPCLAMIDPSRAAVQALIVVPTRELGLQVAKLAKRLAAGSVESQHDQKIMVMSVLQGSQNKRQRAWAWADPPHVVIGTPEELCKMVRYAGIKRYNSVQFLIVDEVDACLLNNAGSLTSNLQSGPLHELLSKHLSPTFDDGTGIDFATDSTLQQAQKAALNSRVQQRPLSQKRQTIFCSATIPQPRHFLRQCVQNQWMLRQPTHVCLRSGEQLLPETLEHAYTICRTTKHKLVGLRRLLLKIYQSSSEEIPKKVLVFCETNRPMQEMARVIAKDLYSKIDSGLDNASEQAYGVATVSVLQFDGALSERAAAMDVFRGEADDSAAQAPFTMRILLSTDMAARGLDVVDITHVIHFDLPPDADTYTHRAGRAGRFGRQGQVISIIPSEQEFALQRQANKINLDLKCIGKQRTKVDYR